MTEIIRNLINNLGYIVLIAFSVTNLGLFKRLVRNETPSVWQNVLLSLLFGGFGIISTYFGIRVNGAIANTRIIGVMAGGLLCGPFVGIGAGIVSGVHRFLYDIGGITTVPCTITTFLAGISAAIIYKRTKKEEFWLYGLIAGLVLESIEMVLILTLSRPFEQALAIVKSIYVPMSFTNAIGIAILIAMIQNSFREKELIAAWQAKRALDIARRTLPLFRETTPQSIQDICDIIVASTGASAVVITDQANALAFAGDGMDFLKKGEPLMLDSVQKVLSGEPSAILNQERAKATAGSDFPYQSGILVPLKEGKETRGILGLFFSRRVTISYSLQTLAEGLSQLISTQMEISKVGKLKELAIKSEVKALQAQINPHFLFNVLNTIASFLRTNPAKARELVINLSTFLRYNIDQIDRFVDLDRELEQVRAYVDIEKARFGNKLRVVYEIDEDVHVKLPSLIIQPLVENAIKHGIFEGRGSGTVRIAVRPESPESVRIAVDDDGIGISEEAVERLRTGIGDHHVGLMNVDSRLKLIYQRGLEIERLDPGTRISFVIDHRQEAIP